MDKQGRLNSKDKVSKNLHINLIPQKIYFKKTEDFMKIQFPQFYTSALNIPDIQLECEGYSLFNPEKILEKFLKFFHRLCNHIRKEKICIKSLKITINGFEMEQGNIFTLVANIKQIATNLSLLHIHTSDLSGVTLADFEALFKLISLDCQNGSTIYYEDFSLQCANWSFMKRQPNVQEFQTTLKKVFNQVSRSNFHSNLLQKVVRLEFSGWWYLTAQAKSFLGFIPSVDDFKKLERSKQENYQTGQQFAKQQCSNRAKKFNEDMFNLISDIINTMSELEHIEIDMRNNHELLQLSKLKQKIASEAISDKKNISQKSLISMQRTTVLDQVKHLRVYFAY